MHRVVDLGIIEDVCGGVEAEVAEELFLAENRAPHCRVDPIGSDQQISADNGPLGESDLHAAGRVLQIRDAAAVAQVDLVDYSLAKRQLQIGAHDAEQPTVHRTLEAYIVQSRASPTGLVDVADFLNPVAEFPQPR